ncbi:uncharacterized protein K444DRAFT_665543 [Hyaloscypha bicolor E]|uniref:Uncharacterized protein n=1 Tax=Hyaloscypha bicolor E TaxID=1095630 RepID=A0A2J6T265_9HELO|nr:uncharacterized protein K444DRAFT_665543 [Hyaloscypha bicolor E]PMD57109.1 hypothetical protein K444DRAFT_665543 [Hyaloscypha bicolor E]
MHLGIDLSSRFFAAQHPQASATPPTTIEDRSSSGSTTDPGASCTDTSVRNQVMELADSDEESSWDETATLPDVATSIRMIGNCTKEVYPLTRNVSLFDVSNASDNPSVASECVQIWSDEDDNGSQEPPSASMPAYGASLAVWKDVLSDPRSSIWKGRAGAKVAVVLQKSNTNKERVDKGPTLHVLSVSEENAIAGRKDQPSKGVSTSRDRTESRLWHGGGGFDFLVVV